MSELLPVDQGQPRLEQLAGVGILPAEAGEQTSRRRWIAGRAIGIIGVSAMALLGTHPMAHEAQAATVRVVSNTHDQARSFNPAAIENNSDTDHWAGFGVQGVSEVNIVTADFTVPSVSCPESGFYETSIWAGAGSGNSDSDPLIQTGISIVCADGDVSDTPFYEEFYPDAPEGEEFFTHLHNPVAGDQIVAEVLPGNTSYFYVEDYGTNPSNPYPDWTDTTSATLGFTPSVSEEECIAEDPLYDDVTQPLLDFGTLDFVTGEAYPDGGCDVTADDNEYVISSSSGTLNPYLDDLTPPYLWADDIENSSTHDILATTSGESSSGAFSITWDATS